MYRVGVFGATGQVGAVIRSILLERSFPVSQIRFFASSRSAGTKLDFNGEDVLVEDAHDADFSGLDLSIFSAGASASKILARKVAEGGSYVIDNSPAWRMDPEVPLVVPEVNGSLLADTSSKIIANPNCTTMVAVLPLQTLHKLYGLKRVVASTYQAVSGAGRSGVDELQSQLATRSSELSVLTFDGRAVEFPSHHVFPATIGANVIPLAGSFVDHDTTEELKFVQESQKILGLRDLKVFATCVRVPVFTGHSISITAEFENTPDHDEAIEALGSTSGVRYDPVPTPLQCAGRDEVLVGRVRADSSAFNSLAMFVVGDNLRKGAALNAVQIAETLIALGRV